MELPDITQIVSKMKRLLIIILFILLGNLDLSAKRYEIEDVPNVQIDNRYCFTSNPDGILSEEAVAKIDSICYSLREEGLAQVAVVAIDDIDGGSVFDFAYELFSEWGVGSQSDRGLGVLLVEAEREIRFLTGYGIEGILPDAICKRIQTEYMLPYFREGDYSEGMVAGMEAVREVLINGDLPPEEMEEWTTADTLAFFGLTSVCIVIVLILLVVVYVSSHKCPKCKKVALAKQESNLIRRRRGICTYEDTYVCSKCGASVKRKRQTADSSYTGGGGRGPFIGGGFGGGSFGGGGSIGGGWGGGSFGGGGAGSRW